MAAYKLEPYIPIDPRALALSEGAFRVYWILCRFRDNRTGTAAFASPTLARITPRHLGRVLRALGHKGLIRRVFGGRYLIPTPAQALRIRAPFFLRLDEYGSLRFRAALALAGAAPGSLSAEGLRSMVRCRKRAACALLAELGAVLPIVRAEALLPGRRGGGFDGKNGSRMSTQKRRNSRVCGSRVSVLSKAFKKAKKPSKRTPAPKAFFDGERIRENLSIANCQHDVDKVLRLYAQARVSSKWKAFRNETLQDAVVFAYVQARRRARAFAAYFWACLRCNLASGYCGLHKLRQEQERAHRARERAVEAERRKETEAAQWEREMRIETHAKQAFPHYAALGNLNPEKWRLFQEAGRQLFPGDTFQVFA